MLIIGLHNDVDAGVVLVRDGVVLDAVGEERLNRVKMYQGPPELALRLVLDRHGLTLDDVDLFAYGWHSPQGDCREHARKIVDRLTEALERDPSCGPMLRDRIAVENRRDGDTRAAFLDWMRSLGVPDARIAHTEHHVSHAWSAFGPSPFSRAMVFTMDGRGDLKSATVSEADEASGVNRLDYLLTWDSLGYLYGKITAYLGFKPHRHEGKVTGLAAHGDPEATLPLFRTLFAFEDGRIVSRLGAFKPFFSITDELARQLAPHSREDVAAGLQRHTEDMVGLWVDHWCRARSAAPVDVCLSGGLFANVRLNQRIAELDSVRNIYVSPNMGDGGIALGSALHAGWVREGRSKTAVPTMYLGPEYGEDAILAALEGRDGLLAERPGDKVAAVVADLRAELVVGYFDGRMEFGPRALGARSVLFHARDASVNDWLNKRMDRTEFMPFAPVSAEEHAAECYVGWSPEHVSAKFMTRTYECTEDFRRTHGAVVHVDGTARPQVVNAAEHGDYHAVVLAYCEATGERAVINTSFNRHEEPIVCTPRDALGGLENGMVDVLYLGPWRVVRKG